jgi:FkbM family methyltransferase
MEGDKLLQLTNYYLTGGRALHWLSRRGKLLDTLRRATWREMLLEQRHHLQSHDPVAYIPIGSFRMRLLLDELQDYLLYRAARSNGYEIGVTRAFTRVLRSGDQYVDAGANSGYFVLLAASIVGQSGHIVAFEPNPVARMRLEYNIKSNDLQSRVGIRSEALGSRSGVARLFVSRVSDGSASTVARGTGTTEVNVTTLDLSIEDLKPAP